MQLQFHLLLLLLIPFKYKCSKGRETLYIHSLLLVVEHWGIRTIAHSQNFSEDLRINLTNGRCCQLILKFAQILLQILLLVSLKWKCSDAGEGWSGLIWTFTFTFTIVPAVAVPFTFPISADTFEVRMQEREREGSGLIWPLYLGAHWHLTPGSSPQRFTFQIFISFVQDWKALLKFKKVLIGISGQLGVSNTYPKADLF